MAEEKSSELKVVDRRRFIQEGDQIRENPEADRRVEPPRVAPAEAAAAAQQPPRQEPQQAPAGAPPQPEQPTQQPSGTKSAEQPAQKQAQPETEESRREAAQRRADQQAAGLPPADFITLLEFLAQQVTLYLGEPDPMGRSIPANLPAAGMFIDLIGVLKEKSTGNLSLEEGQALDQLLYALRLRYVQQRGK